MDVKFQDWGLMNKEEKLVPELRFPDFKNSREWQKTKIDNIAKVTSGGTPDSTNPEYWNGSIPWMNSGELNNKRIYSVSNFITSKGLKESSTKLIPPKCVLIGLAGQGKTRGTAAINYIELCTNQSIASIHPNKDVFDSEFLYQKVDSMYDKLRYLSAGDGGRGGLNLQIIKDIEIVFPAINEQQKIASCLFSLDKVISFHNQKLELLKKHKNGLMQNLFPHGKERPKYRFPEFKNDDKWTKKGLGDIAEIGRGKSKHRPRDAAFLYGGKYPFIQTGDVKKASLYLTKYSQTYSEEGLKQSRLWNEGTLCITIAANIAETAILKIKACFPDSIIGLTPKKGEADIVFIKYLFDVFKSQIQSVSQGVAQDNLNQEKLLQIEFSFPRLLEQQKIAFCLESLDSLIEEETEKISQLMLHKKALLQGLFPKETLK
jgi:type I restriction enzyme, S subunit